MTTLYVDANFYSPYALSAFVAAIEKGVQFTLETVDLDRPAAARGSAFAHASLTSRVPALDHEGFRLVESSAIAEYLDETFEGPRLYPADARARAQARMVQAWIRSDMMALRKERSSHMTRNSPPSNGHLWPAPRQCSISRACHRAWMTPSVVRATP